MPGIEEGSALRGGSDRRAGEFDRPLGGRRVGSSASDRTLGSVPGIDDVTRVAVTQDAAFSAPSVLEVNGVGEITADELGLGASEFGEVPLVSSVGSEPAEPLELETTTTVSDSWGGGPAPEQTVGGNDVVSIAQKYLGVPYVWGGTSPSGFDCSGFVQYVYKRMGINLPRISADQARAGKQISLRDVQAGDLVAIDNSSRNNGADHIGIALGNGMVIHAPRPGSSVRIDDLSAVFGGGWGVRL